jgi:hypothetical protein
MSKIRLFYDDTGKVVEVEHRVDERYTSRNIGRQQMQAISTTVIDSEEIEGIAFEDLVVREGKVHRPPRASAPGPEETRAKRMQEIREMDKSKLSDTEWLKLFREYTTLTGGF